MGNKIEYETELRIWQHRWREMQTYLNNARRDTPTARMAGNYNALVSLLKHNARTNTLNIIMRENPPAAIDELIAIPYAKYKELTENVPPYTTYYPDTAEILGNNAQRCPTCVAPFNGKPAFPYTEKHLKPDHTTIGAENHHGNAHGQKLWGLLFNQHELDHHTTYHCGTNNPRHGKNKPDDGEIIRRTMAGCGIPKYNEISRNGST